MTSYIRVTKLTNIVGRGNYISSEEHQECIVVQSDPVDWKPYHEYEQSHQRTNKANNEGREIIIALPNEWAKLPSAELTFRAKTLAWTALGKSTEVQWAVHWNKARTNLHMHVVFSERQKIKSAGYYDRNIYLTADGKVARRKTDRALDSSGKVKPPVYRKGERKDCFSAKDIRYKSRSWAFLMKVKVQEQLQQFGACLGKPELLHQYHEGKGSESRIIHKKNLAVVAANKNISAYLARYGARSYVYKLIKADAVKLIKQGLVPCVGRKNGTVVIQPFNHLVNALLEQQSAYCVLTCALYSGKVRSLARTIKNFTDFLRKRNDVKCNFRSLFDGVPVDYRQIVLERLRVAFNSDMADLKLTKPVQSRIVDDVKRDLYNTHFAPAQTHGLDRD